jgi:hypothetical protein
VEKAIKLISKQPDKLQNKVPQGNFSGEAGFHSRVQAYLVNAPRTPAIPM